MRGTRGGGAGGAAPLLGWGRGAVPKAWAGGRQRSQIMAQPGRVACETSRGERIDSSHQQR